MSLRSRVPCRKLLAGLLIAGLAFASSRGTAQDKNGSRDREIADTLKQIEALNKKLTELRKPNGHATTPAKPPKPAPPESKIDPAWVKTLAWRSIGPATMGGRITAFAVFDADPSTYWVATASGGLLKTANNGVTFEHQFDRENTVSVGDVCVAPSDRNVVWVGTGEANPRNSVSYGDGVYKSTDGGKSWKHMGLKQSFQIGRILIHPKDPNTVYVGALGRLYGPSEERGLFKTTDGGKSWQKILYVDEHAGVIDARMSPSDPDTLWVATWQRQRDGFDSYTSETPQKDGYDGYDPCVKWGPGSGIYKTTDGGKSFHKLTRGLPTVAMGRIGLDVYRKDPKVVFAIIDTERVGMGPPPSPEEKPAPFLGAVLEDADAGAKVISVVDKGPADKAGLKAGDIILAADQRPTLAHKQLQDYVAQLKPGTRVNLKVARNRESKDVAVTLGAAPRPRKPAPNTNRPYAFMLGGQNENVQDKQGPDGFQTGGVYKSTDGGESWTRINSINPRPMYFSQVRVDPSDDKFVYVTGFFISRSTDGGKTFKNDGSSEVHPDQHALWIDPRDGRHMLVGCDGGYYVTYDRGDHWDHLCHMAIGQFYHVTVDTRQPYNVYGGLQDNGSWGGPNLSLHNRGPSNDDWIMVGFGDGFVCRVDPTDPDEVYWEAQDGNMVRRNLKTGKFTAVRPPDPEELRVHMDFRTSAAFSLLGIPSVPANLRVEKTKVPLRFNWNTPFILSSFNPRIFYCAGNYVFRSVNRGENPKRISPPLTHTPRGAGTALAESPKNPDVLWAGTDDGALWVTRDGGEKWTEVSRKVGLPGPRWVASIEPSRFSEGRAYVAFDAHRSDDDQPYVFVTEDYGQTWKPLRANLPAGSSRVLREDPQNGDLLYLGTEFAAWASLDRGESWFKLNNNLPTVAVHEFAFHPETGEMVAATHGRSLWILDVKPLRQVTADVLRAKAHLFEPNPAVQWRSEPGRGSAYGSGHRHFFGENPPRGAVIYYSFHQKPDKATLQVVDYAGKKVKDLKLETAPGLHKVVWDLTRFASGMVGPGLYRVVLTVDGIEHVQTVRVDPDPTVPNFVISDEEAFRKDKDK